MRLSERNRITMEIVRGRGSKKKNTDDNTYISLQIFVPRVRLDADQVAEHARHEVVARDDDLLAEKF